MKKKTFSTLFAAMTFCFLSAQGPYAGFNTTYGIPIGGTVLGHISSENLVTDIGSFEVVKGSFGSGLNVGSYFGYMFNENIGFDIGVNYLWGSTYTFSDRTDYGSGNYNEVEDKVSVSSFRVSPAFRIGFGSGKIRPFVRTGMVFGMFNKLIDDSKGTTVGFSGTDLREERFEMTQGSSIGFTGALGVNYSFSESVFVFAEMTNYLISWAPEKGELVKSTLNGTNVLGNLDIAQKQYEFVDKVETDGNYVSNAPTVTLKNYFPMSSFGISIGMHFAFGK